MRKIRIVNGVITADFKSGLAFWQRHARLCVLLVCLWPAYAWSLPLDDLPAVRNVAAALAEPVSRNDALLTSIAVDRLLKYGTSGDAGPFESIEARFRAERAWLDELASRYETLPSRSPVVDPAAWYLGQELAQHGLVAGPHDSPLGPGPGAGIDLLFDRENPALAGSLLPELLPRYELAATVLWSRLLDSAAGNDSLLATVSALNADWFDPWLAAEPPAPLPDDDPDDDVLDGMDSLIVIALNLVSHGPPDRLRMRRLRYDLLEQLPGMGPDQARQTEYLLLMASAIDGLADGHYLSFSETLLWIASDLLLYESTAQYSDPFRVEIARLLSQLLPELSGTWSAAFAAVDPSINSSLATTFEVAQYLSKPLRDPIRMARLHGSLADAIAQFGLMIPDMAFYFDQPIRQPVSEEINRCIGLASAQDANGQSLISREEFDGCLRGLEGLVSDQIRREELAGDIDGPFGHQQLRRELMLTPAQRINFVLGNLLERNQSSCEAPDQPLPNPLEWSVVANSISWMARQSPLYFKTPENEALVSGLLQRGKTDLQIVSGLLDCISGTGGGINDPVLQAMGTYAQALEAMVGSLRQSDLDYREQHLRAGADVMLRGGSQQQTAYRPDDLTIGPCNPERVCEMSGELEATRALAGIFPDPYLLAHQSQLGEIKICYENVEWTNRRSEPVREDDPHVANFYGQLSFDLVGQYTESGEVSTVFASNIVSPVEHHYLFGPAIEEVLADSCPMEWIGTKTVTRLSSNTPIRVVPDRLTYLAGIRTRPSEVISANWAKGDEWRDWFVTGLGVTRMIVEPDHDIAGRLDRHLQTMQNMNLQELYTDLLTPRKRNRFQPDTLYELLGKLSTEKSVLSTQLNLFYPQEMQTVASIRSSVVGGASLLDIDQIRRFRSAKVPISEIHDTGLDRLEALQSAWKTQPESVRRAGSTSTSVAQALLRLDQLYQQHFNAPVSLPGPEMELLPPPD